MLRLWLWLAHRPHVSEKGKAALLRHFGDIRALYEAGEEDYRAIPGLRRDALESLLNKDLSALERILQLCRREDIRMVTYQDAAYPNCLRSLEDMPVLLYYKGTLPDFDNTCVVGVSGTRKASAYGLLHARRMSYEMGLCGATVVTGLAAGIDTQATLGALEAGAVAVGVLGCGIDRVYPAANRELYEKVKGQGCILSEYAPGTEPFRWNFPKRNRIITGLSSALLVVEAPEKSGALITAAEAQKQGRDVFVVPGNLDLPGFAGSNRLLTQGAKAALCGWDILSHYTRKFPGKLQQRTFPMEKKAVVIAPEKAPSVPHKRNDSEKRGNHPDKKTIDNQPLPSYIGRNKDIPILNPEEEKLCRVLETGACTVDQLVAKTGLPVQTVLANLTFLELKGLVQRSAGIIRLRS